MHACDRPECASPRTPRAALQLGLPELGPLAGQRLRTVAADQRERDERRDQQSKRTACGTKAPPNINLDSSCPKCNADLHSCRQCTHFDPGARLECNKSIPARIVNKHARNQCELFAARIIVERQTSSGPPTDARDAFAKLFKK